VRTLRSGNVLGENDAGNPNDCEAAGRQDFIFYDGFLFWNSVLPFLSFFGESPGSLDEMKIKWW